jgi:hypothetical protein
MAASRSESCTSLASTACALGDTHMSIHSQTEGLADILESTRTSSKNPYVPSMHMDHTYKVCGFHLGTWYGPKKVVHTSTVPTLLVVNEQQIHNTLPTVTCHHASRHRVVSWCTNSKTVRCRSVELESSE